MSLAKNTEYFIIHRKDGDTKCEQEEIFNPWVIIQFSLGFSVYIGGIESMQEHDHKIRIASVHIQWIRNTQKDGSEPEDVWCTMARTQSQETLAWRSVLVKFSAPAFQASQQSSGLSTVLAPCKPM